MLHSIHVQITIVHRCQIKNKDDFVCINVICVQCKPNILLKEYLNLNVEETGKHALTKLAQVSLLISNE